MTTYEPGTVAVATVRGVEGVRVMAGHGTSEPRLRWLTTDARLVNAHNDGWYFAYDVTDIRPLAVLDFPQVDLNVAAGLLRNAGFSELARQIEAQTKPPRIPEPGIYGIVRAKRRGTAQTLEWLRVPSGFWYCTIGSAQVSWVELVDPTLIREGVESDA